MVLVKISLVNVKKLEDLNSSHPQIFEFQTNYIDNFISTYTLGEDLKKPLFLSEYEFLSQPNIAFPKQMKNIHFIEILVYYPLEFEFLRNSYGIELKEFINALSESALFYNDNNIFKPHLISHGQFFRFKQVKKPVFLSILALLPSYFPHMKKNPSSLLNKVYGAFQISFLSRTHYYICMENLMAGIMEEKGWKQYDLKGSDINRYLVKDRIHRALLDHNFHIERNNEPLFINSEDKIGMEKALEKDLEFLKGQHLVEYSLLIAENREMNKIRLGIIRYFEGNKEENHENEGSKINKLNSFEYANRFRKAMKKNFAEIVS